ncbi:LLM class flavin-dependent oxidoreductase [Puia dinghuensis]|uniref:Oxidoreductase n=1 Tax=Puia dinghuensis TaxID=1792502 RepID=A0A8J2U648_9BACT|nr:LLM class flavin-dependent oxidoreductase [Puia dinghuensis]GGA81151.1 oxidoreductase [Puia dinghuensis]
MNICLPDRKVKLFTVLYRSDDIQSYGYTDMKEMIRLSEEFKFTGLLLFESNRGNLDPWVFAQIVLGSTKELCPFVAVNPIYMHPFSVAKKILCLSKLYERKIYVNFISGTSKGDLFALGDTLDREQRYDRLEEYIYIVDSLLRLRKPVTFTGTFYTVNSLMLSDSLPADLLPEYFIAGSSVEASELNQKFSSTSFFMAKEPDLQDNPATIQSLQKRGVHFGLITRPVEIDAMNMLNEIFKDDGSGEDMLNYSMSNTDSVWKKEMFENSKNVSGKTYSLAPFKNFKADCPYFVGDYDQIGNVIVKYVVSGVSALVVEIPGGQEEFMHVHNSLKTAEDRILAMYYSRGAQF